MTYAFILKLMMPAVVSLFTVLAPMPTVSDSSQSAFISSPVISSVTIDSPATTSIAGKSCGKYEDIIKKYDWPLNIAMAVCAAESGGNTNAIGDGNTQYVSCGLFQIRTLPGRPTCYQLRDPEFNVDYAYQLWKRAGWPPWSVCRGSVDCGL